MPARWRATRLSRWSRHAAKTRPISGAPARTAATTCARCSSARRRVDPSRSAPLAGGEGRSAVARRGPCSRPVRRAGQGAWLEPPVRDGRTDRPLRAAERLRRARERGEVDELAGLVGHGSRGARGHADTGADKWRGRACEGDSGAVAVQTLTGEDGADAATGRRAGRTSAREPIRPSGARDPVRRADRRRAATPCAPIPRSSRSSPTRCRGCSTSAARRSWREPAPGARPDGYGIPVVAGAQGFPAATLDFAIDIADTGLDDGHVDPRPPDFFADGMITGPSRDRLRAQLHARHHARDCSGHGTNVASIAAGFGGGRRIAARGRARVQVRAGRRAARELGVTKIFNCDNSRPPGGRVPSSGRAGVRRRRPDLEPFVG